MNPEMRVRKQLQEVSSLKLKEKAGGVAQWLHLCLSCEWPQISSPTEREKEGDRQTKAIQRDGSCWQRQIVDKEKKSERRPYC